MTLATLRGTRDYLEYRLQSEIQTAIAGVYARLGSQKDVSPVFAPKEHSDPIANMDHPG